MDNGEFRIIQGTPLKKGEVAPSLDSESESLVGKGIRGITRTGARVLETGLGLPGDIIGGGLAVGNYLSGGKIPTYAQIQEKLPISIPTSEDVKRATSYLSGGYTTAQTPGEETYDDVISTMASILVPLPTPGKVGGAIKGARAVAKLGAKGAVKAAVKPLARAAGMAVAGKGAEEVAKSYEFGPLGQTIAKMGAMGLAGLAGGRSGLKNRMTESYDLSKKEAVNKFVKTDKLKNSINSIEKIVDETDFPSKEFIKQRIESIKKPLAANSGLLDSSGKALTKSEIPVSELINLKQGLNEYFTDPSLPHKAHKHLANAVRPLADTLKDYAKENKEFGKYWLPAEDIFTGLSDYSKATRFLNKHINLDTVKNVGLKAVLGYAGFKYGGTAGALGTLGAAFGARESAKFIDFISKSKEAATAYGKMFKYAKEGALKDSARELAKLDKIAEHSGFFVEPEGFKIVSGG